VGRVVVTKGDIRPGGLEKVLGLRADWAAEHPDRTAALVRAIVKAADWCRDPDNRDDLAGLLAEPQHVGLPAAMIAQTLSGAMPAPNRNQPDPADVQTLLEEMAGAGQLDLPTDQRAELASSVWRADIYRAAMEG
jgi:ABC-type nitrate/sulfonate/bicarbonate transport system substrate-binding protein